MYHTYFDVLPTGIQLLEPNESIFSLPGIRLEPECGERPPTPPARNANSCVLRNGGSRDGTTLTLITSNHDQSGHNLNIGLADTQQLTPSSPPLPPPHAHSFTVNAKHGGGRRWNSSGGGGRPLPPLPKSQSNKQVSRSFSLSNLLFGSTGKTSTREGDKSRHQPKSKSRRTAAFQDTLRHSIMANLDSTNSDHSATVYPVQKRKSFVNGFKFLFHQKKRNGVSTKLTTSKSLNHVPPTSYSDEEEDDDENDDEVRLPSGPIKSKSMIAEIQHHHSSSNYNQMRSKSNNNVASSNGTSLGSSYFALTTSGPSSSLATSSSAGSIPSTFSVSSLVNQNSTSPIPPPLPHHHHHLHPPQLRAISSSQGKLPPNRIINGNHKSNYCEHASNNNHSSGSIGEDGCNKMATNDRTMNNQSGPSSYLSLTYLSSL